MLLAGPDTRVVELRVHGIMGIKPEALVNSVAAVDVAGDGHGRLVRPADRLRRPAPGPVLRADGRTVPRIVEGYIWGGMTSGGIAKSTWALLFPFSLANVAHWMLPPIPNGSRVGRFLALANRSILRLAAMLLTMLLVTQLAVISLDLIATQCLAPGSRCLTWVPDGVRNASILRAMLGLLPVLAAIFTMHRVSTVCWDLTDGRPSVPGSEPNKFFRSRLPGAGLAADPDAPTLRSLHTVASLATVALLPLGGPFQVPGNGGEALLWIAAMTLLLISLIGVFTMDDPVGATPKRASRWLRAALGPRPQHVLITAGTLLVLGVAAAQNPLPGKLSGTDATAEGIAAALFIVVIALAVLLVPAALLARRVWVHQPRHMRPWAGGWMAAPVLAMAALLGGGFGAGLAITVRKLIGATDLALPRGYQSITLLWGAGAVLTVLVMLPVVGLIIFGRLRLEQHGKVDPEARLLHLDRPDDLAMANHAWWWAKWRRKHFHQLMLVLAGGLAIGAGLAAIMRLRDVDPPAWSTPLSTVGVLALGFLAGGLLRLVYLAAKGRTTASRLGVLADLACFWPREAHPTVPPCYAIKVVPELVARVKEHLRDPSTRVVLAGHSHGSMLVAFAAARLVESLPESDRERIGIITAGSQLQWAYPRAFPAIVPYSALTALSGQLRGRWRALCRGTDPLGGAVTTWHRQVVGTELLGLGYRTDGTVGALPAARRGPTGTLILGGDHWLPDPLPGPFPGMRWAPGVLGHGDYLADPEWDRAVALAAGLQPAADTSPAPGAQSAAVPFVPEPQGKHAAAEQIAQELAEQNGQAERAERAGQDEPENRWPASRDRT